MDFDIQIVGVGGPSLTDIASSITSEGQIEILNTAPTSQIVTSVSETSGSSSVVSEMLSAKWLVVLFVSISSLVAVRTSTNNLLTLFVVLCFVSGVMLENTDSWASSLWYARVTISIPIDHKISKVAFSAAEGRLIAQGLRVDQLSVSTGLCSEGKISPLPTRNRFSVDLDDCSVFEAAQICASGAVRVGGLATTRSEISRNNDSKIDLSFISQSSSVFVELDVRKGQ
jgi:hypothetical protein